MSPRFLAGEAKAEILDFNRTEPNFEVKVKKIEPVTEEVPAVEKEALIRNAKELLEKMRKESLEREQKYKKNPILK